MSAKPDPTSGGHVVHIARDRESEQWLEFPVGHSADARAIAELTGAFVNDKPTYSSGAIGRLVPDDVAGLIRHMREDASA